MKPTQEQLILQDFLNAVRNPTASLLTLLKSEMESLQQTFDYSHNSMEVIEEEETDREGEEEQSSAIRVKKEFNSEIRKIIGAKHRIEEILNVYKVEIKAMARSIIELEQQLSLKKKEALQLSRKSSKNKKKDPEQQDLKIRQPPQPLRPNQCLNCAKIEQDKNKWKTLSLKIQEFKRRNNTFEMQLKHKEAANQEKQEEINSLRLKVAQLEKTHNSERDEEQRKKLKKDNTNLRGEKVLLTNQVSSLRKQVAQKIEINDVQDIQIKKLRLEIENLNSSLNWHVNNLNELRNSHKRGLTQQQREHSQRAQALAKLNKVLVKALEQQESILESLNSKSKKLEQGWGKQSQRYEKKLIEMESILEDKNETIIKLKTSTKNEKQSTYHSDMIKVLNKKLAEKEEVIRTLQEQMESTNQ